MNRILLYCLLIFCFSCNKSSTTEEPSTENNKVPKQKEWNKNKTTQILYISELQDKAISNYDEIIGLLNTRKENYSLAIIDRSDVQFQNSTINNSTRLASGTDLYSIFSMNQYNSDVVEGSTLLFKHRIIEQEGFKIDNDCFTIFTRLQTKSIVKPSISMELPIATVRIEKESQILNIQATFKKLSENSRQAVVMGTIKKSELEFFKKHSNIKDFVLTEISVDKPYVLFMYAPKTWVLRQVDSKRLVDDVIAYELYLETSVM